MLQQGLARLVKLAQPRPPRLLVVVRSLRERFPRGVVAAVHAGFVETGIVHSPAGRVNPARCDSSKDDLYGRDERYDQVDGHQGVKAGSLFRGAREAVQDE